MIVGGSGVSITPSIEEIKVNIGEIGTPISIGSSRETYTATYHGKICGWYVTGYPTGSIEVNILKAHNAIPSTADVISGTEPPSLSNQTLNYDIGLSTWTDLNVYPGDVFGIDIISATDVENVVITIKVMQN